MYKVANTAIGTASISHNQEILTHGIEVLSYVLPPASNTLHGKLRSLMVDTSSDTPLVLHQIIDARGNRFPVCDRVVVIGIDEGVLPFGLPLSTIVFKGADQFLFLAVH